MDDSDSSSLSSAPSTDDEALTIKMTKPTGLDRYFKPAAKVQKEPTPEPPKRAPSPPHEYTLADNDAIAFIVMFRSRFSEAFPKSLPHYGPQDIERGVTGELPDEQVERLLCALLGLVLNRKKDVERGHYGRALEEAVSANQNQWPTAWGGANALHGGKSFNNMTAEERLILLKSLVLWSLNSSEAVQALIKESYKQTRRDDDKNQPRSVQPWFSDAYRRKYWLIEGLEDSFFRVYRENDGKTAKTNTWFSVAESIPDITVMADKFQEESTTNSKIVADKLRSALPRFEAGDEKRKRREYRIARKAAFTRPEPGFSMYEGRTRGKRMRYTFSDDELDSDGYSLRRSARDSGVSTPQESGPVVTSSGRHVKSRVGGMYGESMLIDQRKELERNTGEDGGTETSDGDMPASAPTGRPLRTARSGRIIKSTRGINNGAAGGSDEDDMSGNEWNSEGDDSDEKDNSEPDFQAEDEEEEDDEDDDMSDDALEPDEIPQDENTQESLVVQLRYRKPSVPNGQINGVNGHIGQQQGDTVNGLARPISAGGLPNGNGVILNTTPSTTQTTPANNGQGFNSQQQLNGSVPNGVAYNIQPQPISSQSLQNYPRSVAVHPAAMPHSLPPAQSQTLPVPPPTQLPHPPQIQSQPQAESRIPTQQIPQFHQSQPQPTSQSHSHTQSQPAQTQPQLQPQPQRMEIS